MKSLLAAVVLAVILGGCGSDGQSEPAPTPAATPATGASTTDEEPPTGEPAAEVVAEWPASWCALSTSSTQEEVREAMGEPTSVFPGQDEWDGFGYSFTAFYDETGALTQLYYNPISLSKAQQERLDCQDVRAP